MLCWLCALYEGHWFTYRTWLFRCRPKQFYQQNHLELLHTRSIFVQWVQKEHGRNQTCLCFKVISRLYNYNLNKINRTGIVLFKAQSDRDIFCFVWFCFAYFWHNTTTLTYTTNLCIRKTELSFVVVESKWYFSSKISSKSSSKVQWFASKCFSGLRK